MHRRSVRHIMFLVVSAALWCAAAVPARADEWAGAGPRLPRGVLARADDEPDPPASDQEFELLRIVGRDARIKQTPHFLVAHDTDPAVVEGLVSRLEQTYLAVQHFCGMNQISAVLPDRPLEVLFFDQRLSFDRYAASISFPSFGTSGVYFEPTNRSAFYNVINDPEIRQIEADIAALRASLEHLTASVDAIQDGPVQVTLRFADGRSITGTKAQVKRRVTEEVESARRKIASLDQQRADYCERVNQTLVQHETAHQVLFNAGVHVRGAENPRWLVEGLACLFETPPGELGTGMAAINQARLKDFRATVAGGSSKRRLTSTDFLEAVEAGRITPPQRLIGDPRVFDERGDRAAVHYAAAWALTHYLQRARTRQLASYLRVLSTREPRFRPSTEGEVALFEAHFGPLDERFLRQWGGHILSLHYRRLKGDLSTRP